MTMTEEIIQAALAAPDEYKEAALKILRGETLLPPPVPRAPIEPHLLGMGDAAKLLKVSRATLWRILNAGMIMKVELFPGSYRVRRQDIEALAEGCKGLSDYKSKRGEVARRIRKVFHGRKAGKEGRPA